MSLRTDLKKLAQQKPELRKHLAPLLRIAGGDRLRDQLDLAWKKFYMDVFIEMSKEIDSTPGVEVTGKYTVRGGSMWVDFTVKSSAEALDPARHVKMLVGYNYQLDPNGYMATITFVDGKSKNIKLAIPKGMVAAQETPKKFALNLLYQLQDYMGTYG